MEDVEFVVLICVVVFALLQVILGFWVVIPLGILTVTSVVSAFVWGNGITLAIPVVLCSFWGYMFWNMPWLVSMIWRKEITEMKQFPAARMYRWFGFKFHASFDGPKKAPPRPSAGEVVVVRTQKGTNLKLTEMPTIKLEDAPGVQVPRESMIIIDPDTRYQKFTGFGTSFTEAAGRVYERVSEPNRQRIIDAYFRKDTGLGFNLGRLHMNSCDFSDGNWTCTTEDDDYELKTFTTERYEQIMLPLVRLANEALGEQLTLVASPWSPPGWLKDTKKMCTGGKLKKDAKSQNAWAQHYVKFAESLKARGLPLFAFSVQNEPEARTPWENCLYTATEERDFVRDYLGPALEASGMDVKLFCWDHNRDELLHRAHAMYSDPVCEKYVYGMCWHWYGDPRYEWWPDKAGLLCWDNVRLVHDMRPDKHLWISETCQECGPHIGDFDVAERYAEAIIKDFNNWAEAWVDWNMVLDHKGGPNHVGNICAAPLHADTWRDRLIFQPSYFAFGQFSRHIQPGATRILAGSTRDCLQVTAYQNPDRSIAVVVLNTSGFTKDICLRIKNKVARSNAPKHSITTFQLLMPEEEVELQ